MEFIQFVIGIILMICMAILMPIYRGLEMLKDYFKRQRWPGAFLIQWLIWIVSVPFAIVVKIFESLGVGGH